MATSSGKSASKTKALRKKSVPGEPKPKNVNHPLGGIAGALGSHVTHTRGHGAAKATGSKVVKHKKAMY